MKFFCKGEWRSPKPGELPIHLIGLIRMTAEEAEKILGAPHTVGSGDGKSGRAWRFDGMGTEFTLYERVDGELDPDLHVGGRSFNSLWAAVSVLSVPGGKWFYVDGDWEDPMFTWWQRSREA